MLNSAEGAFRSRMERSKGVGFLHLSWDQEVATSREKHMPPPDFPPEKDLTTLRERCSNSGSGCSSNSGGEASDNHDNLATLVMEKLVTLFGWEDGRLYGGKDVDNLYQLSVVLKANVSQKLAGIDLGRTRTK